MTLIAHSVCCGCGAKFLASDGPTHRYMTSSAACWAGFGVVLAREYSDRRLDEVHRLSVDTYAVQHPGGISPQCVQSVAAHLCRLCVILENNFPVDRANGVMLKVKRLERCFAFLQPPPTRGLVTVADVINAASVEDHRIKVREWAMSAWNAWSVHHETIRRWLPHELRSSGIK